MKKLFHILVVLFVLSLGLSSCSKQAVVPGDDWEVENPLLRSDLDEVEEGEETLDTGINDEGEEDDTDGGGITDDEDDEDEDDGGALRNAIN